MSSEPLDPRTSPSAFVAVPFVTADQVECRCGHAADLHELEDIRLAPSVADENTLYWRMSCPGYFIPRSGAYGTGARCTCRSVRAPKALPPVEPEPGLNAPDDPLWGDPFR